MEKYSVLMSLYIKEKPEYLDLAIKSMVDQTLKPDEIVIVKDGTITDELQAVLDKYDNDYPGLFNIVGYEKNRGLGLALNFGLEHCRNELVARMDTDDIAVLDRCEKQVAFMEKHTEIAIVGGQIQEFLDTPDNVTGKRIVPCSDVEIKKYMKKRCPFNHMTVMFKKSDILDVGNYQDWFYNEDYYLWIRLALGNKMFANLPEVLVEVRTSNDMYQRRGGRKYYNSEKALQNFMLQKNVITYKRYLINVFERAFIQVVLPNNFRREIFNMFARKKK